MSTARRRLKSSQSLTGTSAHPTMVTLVNIMVMNGWLTSFSFHFKNRPSHSWDKAFSDSDLAISTPRSRSWVWSRSYNRLSIILTHLVFISHQSDQQFLRAISKLDLETWNIQGQGHEWGQRSRSHILPSIQSMHFSFHINRTDHSWEMAKILFDLEKTHPKFLMKICQNQRFQQNCSKIQSGNNHD